jgi:hypothetical protein
MLAAMAGVLLGASAAWAQGYGMAGCGLGALVFGKENTTLKQVLAATTNGSFGTQTFGITSGTSNCTSGGVVALRREQTAFAEVNFQDLKRNMAMGGGEFLASFSTLLGCEEAAKPVLFRLVQQKYEVILPAETTSPLEMLGGVKQQISADARLAGACTDERAIARAEQRSQPASAKAAVTNVALASPAAAKPAGAAKSATK